MISSYGFDHAISVIKFPLGTASRSQRELYLNFKTRPVGTRLEI